MSCGVDYREQWRLLRVVHLGRGWLSMPALLQWPGLLRLQVVHMRASSPAFDVQSDSSTCRHMDVLSALSAQIVLMCTGWCYLAVTGWACQPSCSVAIKRTLEAMGDEV